MTPMSHRSFAFTKVPAWALGALLFSSVPAPVAGSSYLIVAESDGFSDVRSMEINNSGVVVFAAKKDGIRRAYKTSSGGSFTVYVAEPGVGLDSAVINNGGVVAVVGERDRFFLYGSSAGRIDQLLSGVQTFSGNVAGAVLNDKGVFHAGTFLESVIFTTDATRGVEPCRTCPGLALNKNNQLLNIGAGTNGLRLERVDVELIQPTLTSRLYLWRPVRTNVVATIVAGESVLLWATMNDSGLVAYQIAKADGTQGIYKSGGETVVEDRPGSEFSLIKDFAMNNSGEVVFFARSRTLNKSGFFRGTSPLVHRIIAAGDLLGGSRVVNLGPVDRLDSFRAGRWLNDSGQILIATGLQGQPGKKYWVTDGVPMGPGPAEPEPTIFRYVATASSPGDYGAVASWQRVTPQPPTPEPPRVPEKTTNHLDIILYDRPETYSVNVGSRRAHRLIVKDGEVTLTNGSIKVDALSDPVTFVDPSAEIDDAALILADGFALTNNHAVIGATASANVSVDRGATWNTLGSLRVGRVGQGNLFIGGTNGIPGQRASVISAETLVGTGLGNGHAQVTEGGTWDTANLALGVGGGEGEIRIFIDGEVNSDSVVIGLEPGLRNRIIVDGSFGGAPVFEAGIVEVGRNGVGHLRILDGGRANVAQLRIGTTLGALGDVLVSGGSGETRIDTGSLIVGESGQGDLTITNGGIVQVAAAGGQATVGGPFGGLGKVTISGKHPVTNAPSSLIVESGGFEFFEVGSEPGQGEVLIENGGRLEVRGGSSFVLSSYVGLPSRVTVSGPDSVWHSNAELYIGQGDNVGGAILSITNGRVEASFIYVQRNGRVEGTGTLAVPPSGRVTNYNGFIAPGFSPGVLTIEGSYGQGPEGRLLIEIGGTNSTAYDQLIVTNEVSLDGQVTFKFVNGFAPRAGQQFDFLHVGGPVGGAFARAGLQNLAPGFQFSVAPNGPALCLTALNDGVYDPSLPGQVQVTVTNVGGISYASYVITTSNTCDRVELEGLLVRTNNTFRQAFQGTRLTQADCLAQETNQSGTLVLGALAPGEYAFDIVVDGQVFQSVPFTVPAYQSRTLLNPTRLPDGSVRFDLNGLAPVPYRIEYSTDLRSWTPLASGLLPATFTDPDAAIFPTRFYRAVIGQ